MITIMERTAKQWLGDINELAQHVNQLDAEAIAQSAEIARSYLKDVSHLRETLRFGCGFVEIVGLPLDPCLPPPPTDGKRPAGKGNLSELCMLGATHALGLNPFGYEEEKAGALVHEIAPVTASNNSVSSAGTVKFDFHTDGAYLDRHYRPHTLSLLCLVDDTHTGTQLAPLSEAIHLLDHDTVDVLLSDVFEHSPPETFEVKENTKKTSVLDRLDGIYEIKVALHNTKGLTAAAKQALSALRHALSQVATTKHWQPGDLVIFSNLRCLHGRGEIRGRRWLQRCYGSHTLKAGSIIRLEK